MDNPIHDLIKIQYIRQGYLPNIPYHLISDDEMLNAFLGGIPDDGFMPDNYDQMTDEELIVVLDFKYSKLHGYFINRYPCPSDTNVNLKLAYYWLIQSILDNIKYQSVGIYRIPDWIYSYMLGVPISDSSDIRDKHNFLTLIDMDNIYDTFDEAAAKKCNEISTKYLKDHHITDRTPSVFGEPHVVKSARLEDAIL